MAGVYEVDQVGKREELADIIANIIATETPFTSMLKKSKKPNQILMSYQSEVYPDFALAGIVDGTDVSTYSNQAPRYLIEAVGQQFRAPWQVTTIADATVVAGLGGAGEVARQKYASLINLKRIMERRFLSAEECSLDDKSASPYATRGALEWIKASAHSVKPVNAALVNNSASIYTSALSSFTEAAFKTMIAQAAKERNASVNLFGLVGPLLKNVIDAWTVTADAGSANATFPVRQYNQNAESKQLINVVDKLRFSEGTVDLMTSYHLARDASDGTETDYSSRSGLFLDMSKWDQAAMEMPVHKDLPDLGGGPRGYYRSICGLRCYNPLGQLEVYTNT